jgi:Domain of Unknown Function with PDB structure (DUF3857)
MTKSIASLRFLLLATLMLTLFTIRSHARWAERTDVGSVVNFERSEIHVKRNGTFTVIYERQVEILKESARMAHGLERFNIQSKSTIEILDAHTINGKKSIAVPKRDIEIKPLASSGPGFDRQKQVSIAFPEVNIGSKLYLKYKKTLTEPQVPGYYSHYASVGVTSFLEQWDLRIQSEVPLYFETHDPQNQIGSESSEKSVHLWLKSPAHRWPIEEESSWLNPQSVIWVGITTAKDWQSFPRPTIDAYDKVMASALPTTFDKIRTEAALLQTPVEQINYVTSHLAELVRYVGDWRPVRGAFHPRSLKQITDSGYGDCKDFTVSTGSILKSLGYEVHAAWVSRGKPAFVAPLKISALLINHAILYAVKDGHEFWIDPTNTSSFAQGIYSDIADRPALVLKPNASEMKWIPAQKADDGAIALNLNLGFPEEQSAVIEARGKFALRGHAAVNMTAAELSSSKKSIDYQFIQWITEPANLQSWEVGNYELKSRIVKDLATDIKYKEVWRPVPTTAGKGYVVPTVPHTHAFRIRLDDRVSDLRLEDPNTWSRTYRLSGRDVVFNTDIECEKTSPWADFSRKITRDHGDALIVDTIKSKMPIIPVADLKSKEFAAFQSSLLACLQEAVVIFK